MSQKSLSQWFGNEQINQRKFKNAFFYDVNKNQVSWINQDDLQGNLDIKKTIKQIKKVLNGIFKKNSPAVLYGGSVDGSNVEMFKEIREIDGFLIGGASKTSKKFIDIIKNYYR